MKRFSLYCNKTTDHSNIILSSYCFTLKRGIKPAGPLINFSKATDLLKKKILNHISSSSYSQMYMRSAIKRINKPLRYESMYCM